LVSISKVNLHWALLVVGWVTMSGIHHGPYLSASSNGFIPY